MKLLGSANAASTNNNILGKCGSVYVTTTAAHTVSIVANDGANNATDGTVVGTVVLPSGWTGIISKDPDQYIKGNNTSGSYTAIAKTTY